jgi:hypothetical protein
MGMSYGLTVSFNRRYLLKDGTVKMNPGRRNPDIVRPAGPVDLTCPLFYLNHRRQSLLRLL